MADFIFGLNTSTIQPVGVVEKIEITAKAGYGAIELWIDDVDAYVKNGGKVRDLTKRMDDLGLQRPSMISLRNWVAKDDAAFETAMTECRRRLGIAQELGVKHFVSSPPREAIDVSLATDRYQQLLEISLEYNVPASVEFLGFVAGLNTLEMAWQIAGGTGFSQATVTPDAWHMFRGGSNIETLAQIPADHIACVHWNDAPADKPRQEQTDADRVFPGDGVIPLNRIAAILREKNWHGCLSLELFNRTYWEQDPLQVARTGLEKMKASLA